MWPLEEGLKAHVSSVAEHVALSKAQAFLAEQQGMRPEENAIGRSTGQAEAKSEAHAAPPTGLEKQLRTLDSGRPYTKMVPIKYGVLGTLPGHDEEDDDVTAVVGTCVDRNSPSFPTGVEQPNINKWLKDQDRVARPKQTVHDPTTARSTR